MRRFDRDGDLITATMEPAEVELLGSLVDQLLAMLRDSDPRDEPADEDGAGEDGADSADADAAGEGHARGTRLTEAVRDWTQAWTAEAEGSAEAAGASGADDIDADVTTTETGILWEEGAEGGGLRVWVAADAGTVRGLRQVLLKEQGLDRKSCSFMGYWRLGAREGE